MIALILLSTDEERFGFPVSPLDELAFSIIKLLGFIEGLLVVLCTVSGMCVDPSDMCDATFCLRKRLGLLAVLKASTLNSTSINATVKI